MNIADKIINDMPENLNALEKARYLYIELCERFTFSTTYTNTDYDTMGNMYIQKVDVTNFNDKEVICRTWSQLYSQLLNMVGIENEIVCEGHQYVEFFYNKQKWVADGTFGTYTDLARCKNDDLTVGFGLALFQNSNRHVNSPVMNQDIVHTLNNIDQRLGYNTDRRQNLLEFKDYLRSIKNETIDLKGLNHGHEVSKEDELFFKLEYLFSTVGKLNAGYYEQKDFIRHLEEIILYRDEQKQVGAVELKKTNSDKSVDIAQCIYARNDNETNYYLLLPNTEVQKCSAEQIVKLATMGFGIDDKEIPGIIFPKKFKKGSISSDYKYKIYKVLSNKKIIPVDPVYESVEEAYKTL